MKFKTNMQERGSINTGRRLNTPRVEAYQL